MAPTPSLRISRLHAPVTALGWGTRVGVWTQGCDIGCAGCVSLDTWDPEAAEARDVDEVADMVLGLVRQVDADGVTISGGEPFQQPAGLEALVGRLRGELGPDRDLLVFSGYPMSRLLRDHPDLVAAFDAVVAGPYVAQQEWGGPLAGSANQTTHLLTPLAEQRYTGDPQTQRMQISVEDGKVWMIGIPNRGDLDRVTAELESQGIRLADVSWRT